MLNKRLHFDSRSGDLITGIDVGEGYTRTIYMPFKHVKIAYLNLKYNGMEWDKCSPVYSITREEAGYILAHFNSHMLEEEEENESRQMS